MSLLILSFFLYLHFIYDLSHCIQNNGDGPVRIHIDWRERGMVSPVKNQEGCNACWAFSAVACIESHLKLYLGQEETLSEQFLIDCVPGHIGCNSTSVLKTYGSIVNELGGVLRDGDYKTYEAKEENCTWNPFKRPIPVVGYRRVEPDERIMAMYLYKVGPISAAINSASMHTYKGGIDQPTEESCLPQKTDHAVLIVGFDVYEHPATKAFIPYWIIKNSWGTNWGDNGYYYLIRGRNACGIATDVSYPFVK